MYYQECERLASEHPALRLVVEALDQVFKATSPQSLLRASVLSTKLRRPESQIDSALRMLVETGLLKAETMVECPNDECGTLNSRAQYEATIEEEETPLCSACSCDLSRCPCDDVVVYRLAVGELARQALTQDAQPFSQAPQEAGFNQAFSEAFLQDVFHWTPLMRYYSRDRGLVEAQPFADKRVLIVLHFLRDLIPFMTAAESLGLEPRNTTLFYKEYPYPQKEAVNEWLQEHGYRTMPVSDREAFVKELDAANGDQIGPILIVEDGGFFVPLLHRSYPQLLQHTVGAVEQTTRGIMNIGDWEGEGDGNQLAIPVVSVAGSKLKEKFEPPFIARAFVSNFGRMVPNMALAGKEVGLLGYGAIGQELGNWLLEMGANVTVYEPDHLKRLQANQKGGIRVAKTLMEAISGRQIVIGASGRQSIGRDGIPWLSQKAYVASASSEQYEIDQQEMYQLAEDITDLKGEDGTIIGRDYKLAPDRRTVHVLANGYPLNFWGMDSMPEEASDLIMTLILLSAAEVASGAVKSAGVNAEVVNRLADDNGYGVTAQYLRIHEPKL